MEAEPIGLNVMYQKAGEDRTTDNFTMRKSFIGDVKIFSLIQKYGKHLEKEAIFKIPESLWFLAESLNHFSQPFVAGNPYGPVLLANHAFLRLTGYSWEDLRELKWADVNPPEWLDSGKKFMEKLFLSGAAQRYETEILHKDGSRIPVEMCVRIEHDLFRNSKCCYVIVTDLSERNKCIKGLKDQRDCLEKLVNKQAGQIQKLKRHLEEEVSEHRDIRLKLFKTNRTIDSILQNIREGYYTLDKQWRFTFLNQEALRIFKIRNAEELLGKKIWKAFPQSIRYLHQKYNQAMTLRKTLTFELRWLNTRDWFEIRVCPTDDGLSVFFRAITEEKNLKEKVSKLEECFRISIGNTFECFSIYSAIREESGRIVDFILEHINETACYHNQLKKDEQVGRRFFELLPCNKESGLLSFSEYCQVVDTGRPLIKESILYEDISQRKINRVYETRAFKLGDGFMTMWRNITDRKKIEESLRLAEERFLVAFHASPSPLIIKRIKDVRCVEVNSSFERITGFSRDEAIGRTPLELDLWVEPNGFHDCIDLIREQKVNRDIELAFCTKSGEVHAGLFTMVLIEFNGEPCVLIIINDITERKRIEKEMARLDRMNLVGEMAAGIGHEVRNPMTTVRGFLQLLGEKEECSNHKEYFDLMIEELDRANSIITEFLSLAKNKPVELKLQNLNTIIENMLPLIQAEAMVSDKHFNMILEEVADTVLDEKEVRQLILNLVRNGLEAMLPGGCITIKTFMDGKDVVLAVEDQGTGMEPKVLAKIGTPFFTTKDHGTGLGLAVCYSFAGRHNAKIKVETSPDGTIFFVRFSSGDGGHEE